MLRNSTPYAALFFLSVASVACHTRWREAGFWKLAASAGEGAPPSADAATGADAAGAGVGAGADAEAEAETQPDACASSRTPACMRASSRETGWGIAAPDADSTCAAANEPPSHPRAAKDGGMLSATTADPRAPVGAPPSPAIGSEVRA